MGPNYIKNEKHHSIGVHKGTPTLKKLLEESLSKTLEIKAILARGHFDHLIQYKENSEPPILEWKIDLLKQMTLEQLYGIKTICEKVKEQQQRTY